MAVEKFGAHTVIEHSFIVAEPRPHIYAENFTAHGAGRALIQA